MFELTGYTITETIYQSEETLVYRGYRTIDKHPFIIKALQSNSLPSQKVAQFHHAYQIIKDLNFSGIIKHYKLQNYNHTCVLILEDIKGDSLKNIIASQRIIPPLSQFANHSPKEELEEILAFLYLAIQLADSLCQLHAHNIIHKAIQPAHIIVNLETGQVKFTDFSLSSHFCEQNEITTHLPFGTLNYISPEQTGYLDTVIDYRTDFYSLGLVFYEMLIGHPPYENLEVAELIQCHLEKTPLSPHTQNPNIPPVISHLVMKLLAKAADARYQSALALKADLQACLHQLTDEDMTTICYSSDFIQSTSPSTPLVGENTINLTKIIEALQAISGEIVLNHLIKKFMSIVIESTSAEQGWLILKNSEDIEQHLERDEEQNILTKQLFIQAYATALEVKILNPIAIQSLNNKDNAHITLSKTILTCVADTQTPIISNNTHNNDLLINEENIEQLPKSILCLPIIHKQQLKGLFYLENNLTTDAFTSEHLSIIKLLSTQIAISIENAFFYAQLEQAHFAAEQARRIAEQTRQNVEAANRAKSTFLANMSHELRTPLNAILGYSEMIQEEAQESGYNDILPDLDKIQIAGIQLLGIISDILDISKIEAEKLELDLSEFAVTYLVEEMVTTIQLMIEMGGNTLNIEWGNELGMLYADYHKVGQILLNLLNNAGKFTSHGTITLTITRKKLSLGKGKNKSNLKNKAFSEWIFFQIADTGVGIPPEQMNHIFEPFTQGDNSSTREYGGTGLGLTISEYFCRAMGGNLLVSSEVGKGSVFTVQLPIRIKKANSE